MLLFVAICIVFTLLPTYLLDKTISATTNNAQSTFLSVRYLTYADLTGKTVANTVNVGQQWSTQLGLPSSALSVQSTQFQNAATTGKREGRFFRILSTVRESRQTSISSILVIIVKINSPSTVCKTTTCQDNYSNKIKSQVHTVTTVPISFTFTDGTKLDINIIFQTLEDVSFGDSIQTYVEPSIANVNPDALSAATTQPNITYHENPVMKCPVAYVVWYGNWTGNSGVVLIENFLKGIGSTSWWGMATEYTNGSNIIFGQATYDNYSQGTSLNQSMVFAIVTKAISSQALPFNENGIYFVLTSSDVNETEFCTSACGWHSYDWPTKLIYSWIGNSELQCPQRCSAQQTSPNGNFGADAMASVIAHEAMEATTDPFLNAWFDLNGEENADKCAWTFGNLMTSSNGAYYNMIVGGVQFLIQQNWNLSIQNCSLF
ncbi:unnamed protein product [Rotaria magnacalcarata]|uniref:Uncharacterized protein n=1 Tax=Rotaria magnacalcarata TaxID=392030 RepID=A0A816M0H4_9BILA|nr:unnamed protein product [Rotaria magnacalcarata]CAF1608968.1 unnamed protein product [Rotaria magnacalcarata]CAF1982962.1 unnamed protein product [Rotaria magnacalcarata]CAF2138798.1 unnamed protein product [Rotaria magnacalcarata]